MNSKAERYRWLIPAFGLSAALASAQSGVGSVEGSRHTLTAGLVVQTASASIAAYPTGGNSVGISLRDLAIDDTDNDYFLEYSLRWSPRWALVAGSYRFSGAGGRESSRDFEYNDVAFTAGSTIGARIGIDAYLVDVLYRVYSTQNFEIMAGGGVHALDLSASIAGQVKLNDFESEFRQSGTTLLAPVPNLRTMALWKPAERWALRLNAGWLSANVEDYDGAFVYAHLRAVFDLTDQLAIAAGYQWTDIDITQTRARSTIKYDVGLHGPSLTLSYGF